MAITSAVLEQRSGVRVSLIDTRVRLLVLIIFGVGAICAAVMQTWGTRFGVLALAVVLGTTQLIGVCGCAHIGALGPMATLPSKRRQWVLGIGLYTVAGAATSAFVGAVLGGVGGWLPPGGSRATALIIVVAIGLGIARELGWIRVALPEIRRQTHPALAKRLSFPAAAAIWGSHLGLTFATWLTVPGPIILGMIAILSGSPVFAALLFAMHWLGRTLPVWSAGLLMDDASETPMLVEAVSRQRRLLLTVHLVTLTLIAGLLLDAFMAGGRVI